jgi:hypothetical protein
MLFIVKALLILAKHRNSSTKNCRKTGHLSPRRLKNEVVYSVVLTKARNPLSREDIESHFKGELSKK